jgi:hypothetical protein
MWYRRSIDSVRWPDHFIHRVRVHAGIDVMLHA